MDQEKTPPAASLVDANEAIDPRIAAQLLQETTNLARRQFDVWPPSLLFIGAVIFFLAFGAVWWSVRGQHPYVGPNGAALAAMYGGILVWIIVVSVVLRRANSGVGGRSAQQRRAYRSGFIAVLVAYSIFQGALYHAGASHAIVYGVYPASVPWLFAGTVFVTIGAIREELPTLILGIVLVAIGLGSAFAGPVAAWMVTGTGLALAFVSFATVRIIQRRS
ncbi:MAG: hypothetical protein ACYDB2_06185 [Acidimicrobiales bacterium]